MTQMIRGATLLIALNMGMASLQGDAIPMMGGGQVGMASAAMKHLDISFDGSGIHVHVDDSIATPRMRPLPEGIQFSETSPWAMLQDKAYNFQFGWNAGGFISLPPGTGIWIEHVQSTPGLEVYSRPPANPAWAPILGTDNSPLRWKWSGAMTHNVYAVLDPSLTEYVAEYRVYVGDATSGTPREAFSSDLVTLTLLADPTRVLGDFNDDGLLTAADIDLLAIVIREGSNDPDYEVSGDLLVNGDDHQHWVEHLKQTWLGDANLDGEFNSGDLVTVFQAGKYESDEPAGWSEGDWSADARFSSSDLVAAFQDGGFEQGPRSGVSAVPEPTTSGLVIAAGLSVAWFARLSTRSSSHDRKQQP
jgi:hypothetical protein